MGRFMIAVAGRAPAWGITALLFLFIIGGCDPASSNGPATTGPSTADIEAALEAAQRYIAGGRLEEAEIILDELIEQSPRSATAHELMGQLHTTRAVEHAAAGRATEAAEARRRSWLAYESAVERDPDSPGLRDSAGLIALSAGLNAEARAQFAAAVAADPAFVAARLHLAQVLIGDGDLDEAEHHLERIRELDPGEPYAPASLAVIALERGDHERAIELIEEARRLSDADLSLLVQAARIHRRAGDPARALELLLPIDASQRARAGLTSEETQAWLDLGRPARAAEAWELARANLGAAPGAWRCDLEAGRCWLEAGSLESAGRALARAERGGGGDPAIEELREAIRAALARTP